MVMNVLMLLLAWSKQNYDDAWDYFFHYLLNEERQTTSLLGLNKFVIRRKQIYDLHEYIKKKNTSINIKWQLGK